MIFDSVADDIAPRSYQIELRHDARCGQRPRQFAAEDSVRTPESIESAAATAKSSEELKKDLGVTEGATGEMAQIPNDIMFAFDSDQLRPNASNILAECAELIKRASMLSTSVSSVTRTPWGAWTITWSSRSVAL